MCKEILLRREFFEEIFHCEKLYMESYNEKRFNVQKFMCRVFSTLYRIFKQLIDGKEKDYATFLLLVSIKIIISHPNPFNILF